MQAMKSEMTTRHTRLASDAHPFSFLTPTDKESQNELPGILLFGLILELVVLELLGLLRLVVLYDVVDVAEDGAHAFLIR